MSGVNWNRVQAEDFRVPSEPSLADLTVDLTRRLGDVDPAQRDHIALPVLATWIERGVYDDLLTGLGDAMADGLRIGIGEPEGTRVYRRSFSALVLAECITRDNRRPLVLGGKVLEWGDRLAGWLLAERDLRGFVPGQGWAHAIAHGADALGALAQSPHFGLGELEVVLDVLTQRATMPTERLFSAGEADRLAAATMHVLRRDRLSQAYLESWARRLGDAATVRMEQSDADPFLTGGNADAFLRALYLQLAFGRRPPAVRSDLVLVLVDVLKAANPHYLV